MGNTRKDILKRAIIIMFVFGIMFILVGLIIIGKLMFDIGLPCPFYELLHWNCPGCGATRMAVALLHGEFYQAFRYNPFIFVTFPVLFVIFVKQAYLYIRYDAIISWLDKFLIGYIVGLITFAVIRNIEPFTWLAPIDLLR